MKNEIEQTIAYLDYLERHYNNVQKAWEELNEKCKNKGFIWMSDDFIWNIININIKIHYSPKLTIAEFVPYRQKFFPTALEKNNPERINKEEFKSAWKHHLDNNPHHWQHWTSKEYYYPNQKLIYLIENICDWMAMGYEFGDTAKEYYENNKEQIQLPEWAVEEMYSIFDCLQQK